MIDREILCLGHQTAGGVRYTGTAWRMEERMEEKRQGGLGRCEEGRQKNGAVGSGVEP